MSHSLCWLSSGTSSKTSLFLSRCLHRILVIAAALATMSRSTTALLHHTHLVRFFQRVPLQFSKQRMYQQTRFFGRPRIDYFSSQLAQRRKGSSKTQSHSLHDGDISSLPSNDFAVQSSLSEEEKNEITQLTQRWKEFPEFNEQFHIPTLRISKENGAALQMITQSKLLKPYLATKETFWKHVAKNRRPRLVQSDDNDDSVKLVLLNPDNPPFDELPQDVQQMLQECGIDNYSDSTKIIQLRPSDYLTSHVLQTLLPPELHPPSTSFETIGHVAHLNLKSPHLPYRYLIGEVMIETLSSIDTVINKKGEVSGPFRTYPYEILAERVTKSRQKKNQSSTVVSLNEFGINLQFDVRDVYWSSRLSQERKRLLKSEFKNGDWIADAFSGVGALCLQAARYKNCTITANDWNPAAVEALKKNVKRNKVEEYFHEISCGDAYEFLTSLGVAESNEKDSSVKPQNNETFTPKYRPDQVLPDHVVMNFPLKAASFLGALRWWPVERRKSSNGFARVPRVHVYTFAKESNDGGNIDLSVEELAVNEIASNLVPMLPGQEVSSRLDELNDNFGCNVKVHNVRDVAPGKVVLCVSFSATERLLRYMQGDFDMGGF